MREFLKKYPWLGWLVAAVCLGASVFILMRGSSSNAPDTIEKLSETVTIRCTETGNEWTMRRGDFEHMLLSQNGLIDPTQGIPSKFADGRPTGVLVDTKDWTETVNRINAMKKRYGRN
ncbi:MAG: hypothetical protein H6810_03060 [Phycisphaeraceae bacterium]|nr:MAG: hypothetical protein H6810_03060 [Phycisphaeraceae bacterium]